MAFEIESGVAVPEGSGRGRKLVFPFDKMAIGDSFSFPFKERPRVARYACDFARTRDLKFTVRKQDGGTYRIWRIK